MISLNRFDYIHQTDGLQQLYGISGYQVMITADMTEVMNFDIEIMPAIFESVFTTSALLTQLQLL